MRKHLLYEGETEKKLLKCIGAIGKYTKFNPFENDVSRLRRLINKQDTVYLVYDSDVIHDNAVNKFKANIKQLLRTTKKLVLIQQTLNLEDELVYACASCKDHKQLYQAFNAKPVTIEKFKANFIKATNCLTILKRLGFDKEKLFDRPLHESLAYLQEYSGKPSYINK